MKQALLFILCFFSFSYVFGATVTWDNGGGDGNWATAANWDTDAVPGSGDDVDIPTGFTITISSDVGTVKSVTTLSPITLTSSGKLTINGASAFALNSDNQTITNAGIIKIENSFQGIDGGVDNSGTIEVEMNGGAGAGIYLDGTETLTNQSTGIIRVDNGGRGIWLNSASNHCDNFGLIEIGQNGAISNTGIIMRQCTLDNKAGATIRIDQVGNIGIDDVNSATFINAGTLEIGQLGLGNTQYGINGPTVTNQSTGILKIDNVTINAIRANNFTNQGVLTVGAVGSNGGIFIPTSLHNQSGGTMNFSNASAAIRSGNFTNDGTVNFGHTAPVGYCFYSGIAPVTYINNGTVNFKNITSSVFFRNVGGGNTGILTFQNNGTATVAAGATCNISQLCEIENKSGATFTNDGTLGGNGTFIQEAGATFTNTNGIINAGASPGTLTVTGDLALGGGTLYAEINGTTASTQYDVVDVSGTTTITNGSSKLVLDFCYAPTVGDMFDIVTGGGTISGTFAAGDISFPNGGAGSVSVTYPNGGADGIIRVEILTTATLTPEMDIKGNNMSITNGDASPSIEDDTEFGTVNQGTTHSHTFTIENTGCGTLNLTGSPIVAISGSSDFSITTQPPSSVSGDNSTTFVVQYAPTSLSTVTATISIANDDSDENPYTFTVQGTGGAVLPVELIDFKAQLQDQRTYLTWQTASEENNDGFEVQRSADGENWETLDFIYGNGTTLETQNYTYIDENPIVGINYYRLKQIDYDGQFEYSNIVNVTIKPSNNSTISIFPNPVKGQLTIEGFAGILTIYNLIGQPVYQENLDENNTQISMTALPSGQYFVEMLSPDGQKTTKRIVKQ